MNRSSVKNLNNYCVYDFETDGIDPKETNPIQIGAVIVEAQTYNILSEGAFYSWSRPDEFDDENYTDNHISTLKWHASQRACSVDDILAQIDEAPPEKIVWNNFVKFLKAGSYCSGTSKFNYPILTGYNSSKFDDIIFRRLAEKYGSVNLDGSYKMVYPKFQLDIMHMTHMWHESMDYLQNLKMDHLREKFTFPESTACAHDALQDVLDEATLLKKYLNIHKFYAPQIRWKA